MQLAVNIVVLSAIYALIACGYVLIYRVSRVINLAHGELMMLGAYLLLTTAWLFAANPFTAIACAIVLSLAVGIPVLTDKVDIAHARLEFAGGAVANVTASRVSTERVRKMRFFQHHEYISLDYARRDALRVGVKKPGPQPEFGFEKLAAPAVEPLRAELEAFAAAVHTRVAPKTDGVAGRAALELASRVMQSIREHDERVKPVANGPVATGPAAKSYPDKASQ